MPTIEHHIPVHIDATEAWERVADLAAVNQLISFLGEVTVDGDRRSCSLGDLGTLDELILSVDHERRRVAYSIQSSPVPMTHHSASMTVDTSLDGSTQLVWTTDYAPVEITPQLRRLLDDGAASMTAAFAR